MLKTMRNNFKSYAWTLWLVILAFVGGFIFFSSGVGGNEQMPENTVLTVGNRKVSDSDFQTYLLRAMEGYSRQFKGNFNRSLISQLQIPERVLQDLVNSSIIQQECDRLNLSISDRDLADVICNDSRFQQNGQFIGTVEYERLLSYNQIRVKDFESELRQSLLADKLRELVTAGSVIDWDTLKEDYRKENDKADLEYVTFKTEDVKDVITPSEDELLAYYKSHAPSFNSEETRSGHAIIVKLNDFRPQLKVSDKDLFDHYQTNKSQYRLPGKTKVSRIYLKYGTETREAILQKANDLARNLNRDNFAQFAKDTSEDDKAKDGGDWGYFAWRNLSSQEQTMIERLPEMKVSTPIDAGGGYSLLLITEKVTEKQEAYDDVKTRIRTVLENEKLRQLAGERMTKIHEQIKEAKDLKTAAADQKLPTVAVGPVSNGQALPKLDDMGYISRRLFEMQPGQICPPAELPDGMFIVQMQTVHPPRPLPFASVHDKVRDEVVQVRKLDLMQAKAQLVARQLNALSDAKKSEEFLKTENLKKETAEYRRGDRLAGYSLKGLDNTVFAMTADAFFVPVRLDTAVAIIRLKGKTLTGDADFSANRQQVYEKKLGQEKDTMFSAYISERRSAYKTKFNNELFAKVKEYAISRYR